MIENKDFLCKYTGLSVPAMIIFDVRFPNPLRAEMEAHRRHLLL